MHFRRNSCDGQRERSFFADPVFGQRTVLEGDRNAADVYFLDL